MNFTAFMFGGTRTWVQTRFETALGSCCYKINHCNCIRRSKKILDEKYLKTVKLGYNELGFNEHSVITNK